MLRTEITAALVQKIDRMLRVGMDMETIATAVGITPYVAEIIARYQNRKVRNRVAPRAGPRVANAQKGIDAMTIRCIQRMLDVGMLPYSAIAREAGVSDSTVANVAEGKRPAVSLCHPFLDRGEQFVPEGIRCSRCGAMIVVVPCRACRAQCERNI